MGHATWPFGWSIWNNHCIQSLDSIIENLHFFSKWQNSWSICLWLKIFVFLKAKNWTYLGGQLLTWGFSTSWFTRSLLGTCHSEILKLFFRNFTEKIRFRKLLPNSQTSVRERVRRARWAHAFLFVFSRPKGVRKTPTPSWQISPFIDFHLRNSKISSKTPQNYF